MVFTLEKDEINDDKNCYYIINIILIEVNTIRTRWIMMLSPQNWKWYFGTNLTKLAIKKYHSRSHKSLGMKKPRNARNQIPGVHTAAQ